MHREFELGSAWRLKDKPAGDVYTVLTQSLGIGAGTKEENEPKITFECGDETVSCTVRWATENMVPV